MRTQLNLNLVRVVFTFDEKPVANEAGDVITGPKGQVKKVPNTERKEYIVFDTHKDAPKGFALKVAARSKSFLVQVRVGTQVIKTKLGDIKEFPKMSDAYKAGFEALEAIRATGKNPNTIRRQKQLDEYSLQEVFASYRDYLVNERKPPAKPNSLMALDKAQQKFSPWLERRVVDITTDEIKARFKLLYKKAPTATEQAFRWASAAVARKILGDKLAAAAKGKLPAIIQNPFEILTLNNMYRDRQQLEEDYKKNRVRNPLSVMEGEGENLSGFLNTLWDKRGLRRTACDYLLLALLWGCRKNEHAPLRWREKLTGDEAVQTSWVDIRSSEVFFYNTKNGTSHLLPLGPFAKKLLKERQELMAQMQDQKRAGKWSAFVFPAESPSSKTGHYGAPEEMLKSIREDAGIERLTMHDLRRTVGRICDLLDFSENMTRTILNHGSSSVTTRYTEAEWSRVAEHVARLEQEVIRRCPRMWNALRPLDVPPLELAPWSPKPLRVNKSKALGEAHA